MRQYLGFRVTLVGLFASVFMIACGGEKTTEPAPPAPTSIQLSATSVSLRIAETRQITATVVDQERRPIGSQSISWRSSDTTRLTIDAAGSVRALRPGAATLIATSGALTASVTGTVIALTTQLEQAAAVSATIGAAGGQIDARASNGTRFTLSVPPQALSSDTSITVTPIASIDNMPNGTSVVTSVRLQPDGLKFLAPVVLTMDLPAAPNRSGLSGMRIGEDGSLLLAPVTINGSRMTMTIAHFSDAVVGDGLCGIPLASILGGQTAADIALAELASEQCNAGSGSMNATTVLNILHKWYTTSVKPGLQSATTSVTATASFGEWVHWRHTVDSYLPILGPLSGINATVAEAKPLAVSVVKGEIARQNQLCITNQDLSAASKVFQWQTRAQSEQLATAGSGLDAATVLAGICVRVVIEQANFPSEVGEGEAATLTVRAGLRFGTGPVTHSPSVSVQVTASGATPTTSNNMTGSSGQADFALTLTVGNDLQLDVRVAPTTPGLESFGVRRDTVVQRQPTGISVSIEPTAAFLDPGTQAQFAATVHGTTNQAVTWSQTGGTISATGLYTAGSVSGMYSVTATSVANNTNNATAPVEIFGEQVVYSTDFASGVPGPEWSSTTVTTSPNGQRFSGPFQSNDVRLTLSNLLTHAKLIVEFDVYVIDTWDGNHPEFGPDVFAASIVGSGLLKWTTFSNIKDDEHRQAYPGNYPGGSNPAGTGATINTLGYPPDNGNADRYIGDATYRMRFTVDHTSQTVTISFAGIGLGSSATDERWGLDNVRVSVIR